VSLPPCDRSIPMSCLPGETGTSAVLCQPETGHRYASLVSFRPDYGDGLLLKLLACDMKPAS
jgi:hypothetical protein